MSQAWKGKMTLTSMVVETLPGNFIAVRSALHNELPDGWKMVRTLETDSFIEYVICRADGTRAGTAVVEEVEA